MLYPFRNDISSILDIGCGNGQKTAFLAHRLPAAQVLGIDFSQQGITKAKASSPPIGEGNGYGSLHFQCIDVEDDTPYEHSYDLVFSYHVLEHVEDWKGSWGRCPDAQTNSYSFVFPLVKNYTGRKEKCLVISEGLARQK